MWTYYILKWDRGPIYERVNDSVKAWPVREFKRLATTLEFNTWHSDNTLVGGYYSRHGGDCLLCVPFGTY